MDIELIKWYLLGRLDHLVYVGRPDDADRHHLFKHFLSRHGQCIQDPEMAEWVERTVGWAPSDMEALIRQVPFKLL
jgi:SpoVK/Ycf46/Vps4 family AAA+-type ATPase